MNRDPVLAVAAWTDDLSAPWTLIDIADLPGAPSEVGQFEAVEHISGSTVGVLCEDPPLFWPSTWPSARWWAIGASPRT